MSESKISWLSHYGPTLIFLYHIEWTEIIILHIPAGSSIFSICLVEHFVVFSDLNLQSKLSRLK